MMSEIIIEFCKQKIFAKKNSEKETFAKKNPRKEKNYKKMRQKIMNIIKEVHFPGHTSSEINYN